VSDTELASLARQAIEQAVERRHPLNVRREAERLIREHPQPGVSAAELAEGLAELAVARLIAVEIS
jgi:hypothetical protein